MKILVVGSSIIDLFLKIENAKHAPVENGILQLKIGDKIPTNINKITLGGNGANVSVGLKRLGTDVIFLTYFGDDVFSKEIEETIKKEGINLITQTKENTKSSISFIIDTDKDRIILSHHEYRDHEFYFNDPGMPEFAYLTSIGSEWINAYRTFLDFVRQHNIPFGLTPGSKQLMEKTDLLFEVIKSTRIILINKEEAKKILSWGNRPVPENIKDLLFETKSLGPSVVSITDGKRGAYTIDKDNALYEIHPFKQDAPVVEKTGAGDSYTSGFLAKYLSGGSTQECMKWGAVNAYANMQEVGAQTGLLTSDKMNQIIAENPEYGARTLE